MKKILLALLASAAIFSLSAQIIDETFEDNELPPGIDPYSLGSNEPVVENEMVTIAYVDSINGIELTIDQVTDSIILSLKMQTTPKWTQRSFIQFQNGAGDTIGQVYGYAAGGGGGYFLLNENLTGYTTADGAFEGDIDLRTVGKISGLSNQVQNIIMQVTINVKTSTITASVDATSFSTPLYAAPDDKINIKIVAIILAGGSNFKIDSLAVNGTGNLALETGIGIHPGSTDYSSYFHIRSLYSRADGMAVRPEIKGMLSDYRFAIFDLTGRRVFESSNPTEGWKITESGLYVWKVSGHTPEGKPIQGSGKIVATE